LAGLLDTDGYVKEQNVVFTTVSQQLAVDVKFIVESLGGRANISSRITRYTYKGIKKNGQRSYNVYIKFNKWCPFRLKRKAHEWKPCKKPLHKILKTIDYIGNKPTICISTDAPDGMYLAKDFIATHNTALCMNFCAENIDSFPILMGNEYTTIDDEPLPRFLNRIDNINWIEWADEEGNDRFNLLPVTSDYAEHIVKDRINIIDWINLPGEYYLISPIMEGIKRELGKGIAIIAIQKNPGMGYGRGGHMTKDFADCELLLDQFGDKEILLTVGKVKEYLHPVSGRMFAYEIDKGVKIMNFREVVRCPYCKGIGTTYQKGIGQAQCSECNGRGKIDKGVF